MRKFHMALINDLEVINVVNAATYEKAYEYFAKIKNLDISEFKKIYWVYE